MSDSGMPSIALPNSPRALAALELATTLQGKLVDVLRDAALHSVANDVHFESMEWDRDGGLHGGGRRLQNWDSSAFDRTSCNVSAIHYDDMPEKRLSSATALSCIVHPRPASAPSLHIHISYTEMRDGRGYWRIMADLNPSHPIAADTAAFREAVREAFLTRSDGQALFEHAVEQGDKYFFIPALNRHRGVFHSYLEEFQTGDFESERGFALRVGGAVIAAYGKILRSRLGSPDDAAARQRQLAYHTLYFFQVLTLDRGTTSGLLVHDQNDVGILGSLPSHVDTAQLVEWLDRVPALQRPLLETLIQQLSGNGCTCVTEEKKRALAAAVRSFYRDTPNALALQARGDVVPPTVQNHQ